MNRCYLCNRLLKNENEHYGKSCIDKCYAILDMNNKKIKNKEKVLENRIAKINNSRIIAMNAEQKKILTNRYLAQQLMSKINLPFYTPIKMDIAYDIKNIHKTKRLSQLKSWQITLSRVYEIYKAYNRNKDIINKSTEELLKTDVGQNMLWNGINFGFKRYYYNKDYLEGITQQLQFAAWKTAVFVLYKIDKKAAAMCLNHAIQPMPEDMLITDSIIINEIKNDKNFKNKIREVLNEYDKNNKTVIKNEKGSISFSSGDLCWAFHMVEITINGEKDDENWNLKISMEDTYDFTDLKELQEYFDNNKSGLLLATANNAAMISTSCGVLNTYKIRIEFEHRVNN